MSHYDYKTGKMVFTTRQQDKKEAREIIQDELENNDHNLEKIKDLVHELAESQTSVYHYHNRQICNNRTDIEHNFEEEAQELWDKEKGIDSYFDTVVFCYWQALLNQAIEELEK